jgi:DNA adenine methylase
VQLDLLVDHQGPSFRPLKGQLLKWIGNKRRFAAEIISYFPDSFGTYFEPFLGSGALLATLAWKNSCGSDTYSPLVEIWKTLKSNPELVKDWYRERWEIYSSGERVARYEDIKASYNRGPNGADLLFLSRSCYGGVIRFRAADGYMSTPCGVHIPILPKKFNEIVDEWHVRVRAANFIHMDYDESMRMARPGDLIYCDPPYYHSQAILFGAQGFDLSNLLRVIEVCKSRGILVALSIDGTKKSGKYLCDLEIPDGLFEREVFLHVGRSMLKRFQMEGRSLEDEIVTDRLLLTY